MRLHSVSYCAFCFLFFISFQVRQSQQSTDTLLPAAVANTQVNQSLFCIMVANYSRFQILFFHSRLGGVACKDLLSKLSI